MKISIKKQGELEHHYADELETHPIYQEIWHLWKKNPPQFPGFPKGETLQQFQRRVLNAFAEICAYYKTHPFENICVVTHGGPIRILKCFLADKDLSHLWDDEIDNLNRLDLTPENIMKLENFIIRNEAKYISPKIKYSTSSYSSTHWAHHVPNLQDKNFIATLKINGVNIGLKLNPTDARGYRGIACLVENDEAKMFSTFNRNYSLEEKLALNIALGIFARAYENFDIIAQISIAGNVSQSINSEGLCQIGNEKEPSLLHGHVIGRGNPSIAYIGQVTLKGPKAGLEMNLRGDGQEEGNKSKEKWKDEEMEVVGRSLANEIVKILKSSPHLKDVEIMSIRPYDTLLKEIPQISKQTNDKKLLGGAALLALGTAGFFVYKATAKDSSILTSSFQPK